jgi:hypothetical protein
MQMARKHPSFTLTGELLCLLSGVPKPLTLVAADLDMDCQRDVKELIQRLRNNGHDIVTEFGSGGSIGRVIRVGETWGTATRPGATMQAALEYWTRIYGDC